MFQHFHLPLVPCLNTRSPLKRVIRVRASKILGEISDLRCRQRSRARLQARSRILGQVVRRGDAYARQETGLPMFLQCGVRSLYTQVVPRPCRRSNSVDARSRALGPPAVRYSRLNLAVWHVLHNRRRLSARVRRISDYDVTRPAAIVEHFHRNLGVRTFGEPTFGVAGKRRTQSTSPLDRSSISWSRRKITAERCSPRSRVKRIPSTSASARRTKLATPVPSFSSIELIVCNTDWISSRSSLPSMNNAMESCRLTRRRRLYSLKLIV